jgi:hypothetical protein
MLSEGMYLVCLQYRGIGNLNLVIGGFGLSRKKRCTLIGTSTVLRVAPLGS